MWMEQLGLIVNRQKICECLLGAWLCGAARQILHMIGSSFLFCFLTENHVSLFGLPAQSHGAWTVKSAMRHQPMQGHAPGAVCAECLSLPVGKRCEICCKEAECRGLKRQRKSQVASRV